MMGVTVLDLTVRVIEDAARALEASQVELQRRDLQIIRLREALREALEMVHVGYEPARLQVLHDFLDGKREGL
jgi:hypothetical protein